MRRLIKGMIDKIASARFSYLFFAAISYFLLRPFLVGLTALQIITEIFGWAILISCVWAVHDKKRVPATLLGLVVLFIVLESLKLFLDDTAIIWADKILGVIVFAYAVGAILLYLIRQEEVTGDMIMAVASEYILIGFMFSNIYILLESVYPDSFNLPYGSVDRSTFLYFSFVTLTTTGYGDILPVSAPARSFAMLEQVTGQLFVAVLVARLVGLYTMRKKSS